MRQYYASDKKKREDAKRKQKEEKRLKKLRKNSEGDAGTSTDANAPVAETDASSAVPEG